METLVVVDPEMTEYYKNEDVTTYVLTIMNMVYMIINKNPNLFSFTFY